MTHTGIALFMTAFYGYAVLLILPALANFIFSLFKTLVTPPSPPSASRELAYGNLATCDQTLEMSANEIIRDFIRQPEDALPRDPAQRLDLYRRHLIDHYQRNDGAQKGLVLIISEGEFSAAFRRVHSRPGINQGNLNIREFFHLEDSEFPIAEVVLNAHSINFNFSSVTVSSVVVKNSCSGLIKIDNSNILNLLIEKNSEPSKLSMDIRNTWVYQITFGEYAVRNFSAIGGGISYFVSPRTNEHPIVTGNFFLDQNCSIGTAAIAEGSRSIQEVRNMRSHLSMLDNSSAEHLFYALEKRLDRQLEDFTLKSISYFYDLVSYYGNSPTRTLKFLVSITLSLAAFYSLFGLATVPNECLYPNLPLVGWQKSLCEKGFTGELLRGSALSVRSIFNPAGLFRDSLVTASNVPTLIVTIVQSILSIILSTIFIFGLRRKFKIS